MPFDRDRSIYDDISEMKYKKNINVIHFSDFYGVDRLKHKKKKIN